MEYNIAYNKTDIKPVFYKDAFIIYRDLIIEKITQEGLPKDTVKLINNELINVNRAPLILLKRVSSPQPGNINNINESIKKIGDTKVVSGKSMQAINLAIESYGNSFLEAERLGSLVQEAIIVTSINKINKLSKGTILGHNYLGWSGTQYVASDSKLMFNRIDIRLDLVLDYNVKL